MAVEVDNIQQNLDNHIYDTLQDSFGNDADGDPWIEDPDINEKNKYAIKREYRTIGPSELMRQVKGSVVKHLGAVIVANTRMVYTPIDIMGKRFGARYETLLYNCALNYRSSQLGGDRITYAMNADLTELLMNNPPTINRLTIPFVISATESEFANTEMDVQRFLALIPTSTLP